MYYKFLQLCLTQLVRQQKYIVCEDQVGYHHLLWKITTYQTTELIIAKHVLMLNQQLKKLMNLIPMEDNITPIWYNGRSYTYVTSLFIMASSFLFAINCSTSKSFKVILACILFACITMICGYFDITHRVSLSGKRHHMSRHLQTKMALVTDPTNTNNNTLHVSQRSVSTRMIAPTPNK